jgi:hypothetical protein
MTSSLYVPHLCRLDRGAYLWRDSFVEISDKDSNKSKLRGLYDLTLGTCVGLDLHKDLMNAVGVLVVDLVLLMSMLIGLLRCSHSSSTGLWQLLYQQVVSHIFLFR